jgi:hypothetical protein
VTGLTSGPDVADKACLSSRNVSQLKDIVGQRQIQARPYGLTLALRQTFIDSFLNGSKRTEDDMILLVW